MKPKISIITVVYNNVKHIERTLFSVFKQDYENIELIVIDGKSTDGTFEVLTRFADKIAVLISEKDKGIYDAMNKGLDNSTGDYVYFLNSGDELFDAKTLSNVFLKADFADVYYGDAQIIDENNQILGWRELRPPEKLNWKSFQKGMLVCHQSIIIKKSISKHYNSIYKISADIDWVINSLKKSNTIVNTHLPISKYLAGGLSVKLERKAWKERFTIMNHHYGLFPTLFNHLIIAIRAIKRKLH